MKYELYIEKSVYKNKNIDIMIHLYIICTKQLVLNY